MALKNTVEVPFGQHTVRCSIEVPQEAIGAVVDGKNVSTFLSDITAAVVEAATSKAGDQVNSNNKRPRCEPQFFEYDRPLPDSPPRLIDAEVKAVKAPTHFKAKEDDTISIRMTYMDGFTVHFRMRKHKKLEGAMYAFCEKLGKPISMHRFTCDGARVDPWHTPDSHGMEEGDTIDVVSEQVGS